MDSIPSLNTLRSIRTPKNGETFVGFKKGDDHDQPLSPMARLFHEPGSNVYIIGIMGLQTKACPDVFKENLVHTFVKNRRFSSLQVINKENGSMKWIPTHVNIDDHVIVAELDPNIKSPEKFIEDYIFDLSRSHIEPTKPLWDLHILNLKTLEAESTCVFRFHHSLGDGMSLMNLLLACTRKVSDPEALPTLPGNNKLNVAKVPSLWSRLCVIWNSFVALLMFICTAMFLEDTKTPMKGSKGVEHRARRFVVKSLSLDDIKLVKRAMNVTLNDVVLGVTQAGLYKYLHGRYGEIKNKNYDDIPDNMRFRATFFFNLRATTRIDDFTDTDTVGTWGNKIGYSLLPFDIRFKKDPVNYVRDANAAMKHRKASLEPFFTYLFTKLVIMLFGIKALMIHVVSYVDKVLFIISADEETIPDPHKLCDDLDDALRNIKCSVQLSNC